MPASGDYLIAADGAGSAIRKHLGIEFERFTYPERFLLISTPYEFREAMPDLNLSNYFSDPKEWLVMLRVQEFWRLLFPTLPAESDGDVLAEARLQERLRSVAGHAGPFPIGHKTLYSVHQSSLLSGSAGLRSCRKLSCRRFWRFAPR